MVACYVAYAGVYGIAYWLHRIPCVEVVEVTMKIERKAMRASAQGENCTLQIGGVCNYDASTTVLAHLPDESHGMGRKSDDLSSAYCCAACHDEIDGRRNTVSLPADERDWYMRRAQTRTLRRMVEKGIITIKK